MVPLIRYSSVSFTGPSNFKELSIEDLGKLGFIKSNIAVVPPNIKSFLVLINFNVKKKQLHRFHHPLASYRSRLQSEMPNTHTQSMKKKAIKLSLLYLQYKRFKRQAHAQIPNPRNGITAHCN